MDELRSTLQLAASSVDSSVRDMQVLGQEMAAASQCLWDTVRGSHQALELLGRLVERLQAVLANTQSPRTRPSTGPQAEQLDENQSPAGVQREEEEVT